MEEKTLPAYLAACRKKKGMTQNALAQKLGVTQGRVSLWESGRHLPDLKHLLMLARVFGGSLETWANLR